jgi:hypothetical protein
MSMLTDAEYMERRNRQHARLVDEVHLTADGHPVVKGDWYWDNNLRAVQITELVSHFNDYPVGHNMSCIQVWHEHTSGSSDTLTEGWHRIGRLAKYWEGMPAQVDGRPQRLVPRDIPCAVCDQTRRHTHDVTP